MNTTMTRAVVQSQPMFYEQNVLAALYDNIESWNDSCNECFDYLGIYEVLCPLQHIIRQNCGNRSKPIAKEFFSQFGIRSLAINNLLDSFIIPKCLTVPGWKSMRQFRCHDDPITSSIQDLKSVFRNCWVIAFTEWAMLDGASERWDRLYFDVIKTLDRNDFNFIFHIGDITTKLGCEVEGILDIIRKFAVHGQVTLLLTEHEALKLSMVLHEQCHKIIPSDADPREASEKYRAIFESMRLSHLMIFAADRATLITAQQQFDFTGKSIYTTEITKRIKDNFDAGFSLGLLLELEIWQCTALGLTISKAYLENGTSPDRKALLSYIKQWIAEYKTHPQAIES